MYRMKEGIIKRIQGNRGSITVESCIVLPVFIAVILTLMMLIKVTVVQSIVQQSINESAKQISKYSYVLSATGVKEDYNAVVSTLNENGNQFNDQAEDLSKGVSSLSDLRGVEDQVKSGDIDGTVESFTNAKEGLTDAKEAGQKIMKDPKATLVNFASIFMSKGVEEINRGAFSTIAKSLSSTYISTKTLSANDRLKMLGIVNGMNGVDFSDSTIFMDQNLEDIDIVVRYKLDIPVPIKIFPDFYITQRTVTRGWLDGNGEGSEGLKTEEDNENPE
ncbi:MAG: hypothetical protein ABF289_04915 [Clostridiales bacterium]